MKAHWGLPTTSPANGITHDSQFCKSKFQIEIRFGIQHWGQNVYCCEIKHFKFNCVFGSCYWWQQNTWINILTCQVPTAPLVHLCGLNKSYFCVCSKLARLPGFACYSCIFSRQIWYFPQCWPHTELQTHGWIVQCVWNIRRHVAQHQKTCCATSEDMLRNIIRHVVQHHKTCCATSEDMLRNIIRHVAQHQKTCCATSEDMLRNIRRHVAQHHKTCCETS